jgi:hypothetical protein
MEAMLRALIPDPMHCNLACLLWASVAEQHKAALASAEAALASAGRELQAALASAGRERETLQAALASAEAFAGRERESAKEARESAKEARESAKAGARRDLEFAQREHQQLAEELQTALDQVRGVLGSRSKIERIAYELAPSKSVTAATSDAFGGAAVTKFHAYLAEVARARSMKLADLVDAGKGLYQDLSTRIHHGEGGEAPFEAESLAGFPTSKLVALAALFKFHRRKHGFLRDSLPSPASTPPVNSPATQSPERGISSGGGGGSGSGAGSS